MMLDSAPEATYEKHFHSLYLFVVWTIRKQGLDRETARELAQEAMLKLFLSGEVEKVSTKAWLRAVARNLGQNWYRDRWRTLKRGVEEISFQEAFGMGLEVREEGLWQEGAKDVERLAIEGETLEAVQQSLRRLAPRQRQVLSLWLEGLKYREIALALGISIQAVRSILNQAKVRVQARVQAEAGRRLRSAP